MPTVYAEHVVQTTTSSTLIGTLVRPFDGCLIGSDYRRRRRQQGEQEEQQGDVDGGEDIDMDCLVNACTRLKDVMYMMGQDGNARDLQNNLVKIEQARAQVPPSHRQTLRTLLEYEKESGVKLSGGRLKNPSAAVGLLWIRRSVAFQRRMNSILFLEGPPNRSNSVSST